MFIGLIAAVIALLVIVSYMSTSTIVVDATQVKVAFEKTKSTFGIEKILTESIEDLCQNDPNTCKNAESGGIISLSFSDLSGYIPSNFENDNLYGSPFSLTIRDNNSTIRLTHHLVEDIDRGVYLKHFKGRWYGISPKCVSGLEIDNCTTTEVYHDYPTSLETRSALR